MAFWTKLFGDRTAPPDPAYNPGDPDGVELTGEPAQREALPWLYPSPWSGWPGEWATPNFNSGSDFTGFANGLGFNRRVDIAWAAIDLNSSVLSSFPVYRLQSGEIVDPLPWQINPDPSIYSSWQEFAKQLFWDYLLGEAFVVPMSTYSDGSPRTFRVVPPWMVNVDMVDGVREYWLGSNNVTDEILHIRYVSSTDDGRGHGPLEIAGARITASMLLTRYAHKLAETGGTPHYWIAVDRHMNQTEADDLLSQWVASRTRRAGEPALLTSGGKLNQLQSMNARDMTLLELQQFNEGRIAILCGVPPFLLGLPMAQGESLTYNNASMLFDFHDRSSLRPKATAVMQALSWWALPRGQTVELNRDEYSRPGMLERAQANDLYLKNGVLSAGEVRASERFHGEGASAQLAGTLPGPVPPAPPAPAGPPPPAPTQAAPQPAAGSNGQGGR